jgi:pyrroloquinoline-quinone synthase
MNANELDVIVARYDLNEHPFYQAWRAGTLRPATLGVYASEYAPFIGAVEQGWRTLGDGEHAAEERGHAALWERFRDALGASGAGSCDEVGPGASPSTTRALADAARRAFAEPVSAVGALYAFEAQQPSTARSKLDGLREHYALPEAATAYFREHADDYGERDRLRHEYDALSADGAARARLSCEEMCRAMWAALDGILAATQPELRACG